MNDIIKECATKALVEHCVSHVRLDSFANEIISQVQTILLDMHDNAKSQHNYYLHACLEITRKLK